MDCLLSDVAYGPSEEGGEDFLYAVAESTWFVFPFIPMENPNDIQNVIQTERISSVRSCYVLWGVGRYGGGGTEGLLYPLPLQALAPVHAVCIYFYIHLGEGMEGVALLWPLPCRP